jgi:hypothetical protein
MDRPSQGRSEGKKFRSSGVQELQEFRRGIQNSEFRIQERRRSRQAAGARQSGWIAGSPVSSFLSLSSIVPKS